MTLDSTNSVSILHTVPSSPCDFLPRPNLCLAVALRLSLRDDSPIIRIAGADTVNILLSATPRNPLRVPCLPGETPEALGALLVSLGALIR